MAVEAPPRAAPVEPVPATGAPRRAPVGVGLWALVAAPVVVAVAEVRRPRWFPSADLALMELRVRDVLSAHPSATGLGGRIGPVGELQGSHPGPLAFWVMAPVHRVLGGSSFAFQVAGAALHLAAVAVTLWLVRRRGGTGLALGAAAVLVVLVDALGPELFTRPWNPYLPVLWWVALLVAVWSVLDGDVVALPVAVVAGSLCAQTHISYVGLVAGLAVLTVVGAVRLGQRALPWVAGSAVLGVVLWLPPLVEQLRSENGNLTRVWDHFTNPPEDPAGLGEGVRRLLLQLDPFRLGRGLSLSEGWYRSGSLGAGIGVVVVWAACAVVAWRLGHRTLQRLHVVVGVALALAVVSSAGVIGPPFAYLMLWILGLLALLGLAVGWTVAVALPRAQRLWPALLAVTVGLAGVASVRAAGVEQPDERLSRLLAGVVPDTVAALDEGPFLVTGTDPVDRQFLVYGFVNELDRAGLDVGMAPFHRVALGDHRALEPGDAAAEVHLAVGPDIDRWEAVPGARLLARTQAQDPAEYERLRSEVAAALVGLGREDLVAFEDSLFDVAHDPALPPAVHDKLQRMLALGQPVAVFVVSPPVGS